MADIISVLAGGSSLKGLDLSKLPGFVISVNDAGVRASRTDVVVTMDRLWLEYRWNELCEMQKPVWARPAALLNIHDRPPWLVVFRCDYQSSYFADQHGHLNGTNSGACALNLAYQMKPKKIFLFGFDMARARNGENYWYEPYPWVPNGGTSGGKYVLWSKQFAIAAAAFSIAGISVINASPNSRISVFEKADPRKILS